MRNRKNINKEREKPHHASLSLSALGKDAPTFEYLVLMLVVLIFEEMDAIK